jgi:hypothetical protein
MSDAKSEGKRLSLEDNEQSGSGHRDNFLLGADSLVIELMQRAYFAVSGLSILIVGLEQDGRYAARQTKRR